MSIATANQRSGTRGAEKIISFELRYKHRMLHAHTSRSILRSCARRRTFVTNVASTSAPQRAASGAAEQAAASPLGRYRPDAEAAARRLGLSLEGAEGADCDAGGAPTLLTLLLRVGRMGQKQRASRAQFTSHIRIRRKGCSQIRWFSGTGLHSQAMLLLWRTAENLPGPRRAPCCGRPSLWPLRCWNGDHPTVLLVRRGAARDSCTARSEELTPSR